MVIIGLPSSRWVRASATALCLSLALMVVGTFLPWLRSGRTVRNSYASAAELRQFLQSSGVLDLALRVWTFTSILCALAMLLVVGGRTRSGALLAIASASAVGAVAVGALSTVAHGTVRAVTTGPGWTVAGAAGTCAAALSCLILVRHPSRRFR